MARQEVTLGIHSYVLFLLTCVLINLAPGQDTMFIIGRSLTGGQRAGITAALGIATGCVFHTLAAALGLSAILAASAAAFTAVKLAGAAYLVYLGVQLLRTRPLQDLAARDETMGSRSAFVQGVLTNVLNPKVALFFLALLPQFIDPAGEAKTLAFLALGGTFIATGTLWCLTLAVGAARLRGFFLRKPAFRTWIDRVTGAVFIALGLRLAWMR
jgi:threonine/homoserine/homoserine lactone efflux protein